MVFAFVEVIQIHESNTFFSLLNGEAYLFFCVMKEINSSNSQSAQMAE